MSRALLAGRMQPEGRSVCVFLPDREQLSLTVGVSGSRGGPGLVVLAHLVPLKLAGAGLLTQGLLASSG